jgi:hypothetical protein
MRRWLFHQIIRKNLINYWIPPLHWLMVSTNFGILLSFDVVVWSRSYFFSLFIFSMLSILIQGYLLSSHVPPQLIWLFSHEKLLTIFNFSLFFDFYNSFLKFYFYSFLLWLPFEHLFQLYPHLPHARHHCTYNL